MELPTGVEALACSMCHAPMTYMGQEGYTRYWDCPNECGPETEDLERPETHCWVEGCQGTVTRRVDNSDHPYGHGCSDCGSSLRHHPTRGAGKSADQAVFGYRGKVNG